MKVLMTTDTLGGVWTYCMELCAALAPYEVEIVLATMGRALSPEQRWQVDHLPHVTVHESTWRLCWMQDSAEDVEQAGKWLLALEQATQPDVIHLNDLAHGGLAWRAPVVLFAHSCVYTWWQGVRGELPPEAEWRTYKQWVRQSVQRADLVAAPTQAMLDDFLRIYGPARMCSVIYNGRDFPELAPELTPELAPRPDRALEPENSSASAELCIFAAGRLWDEAKNIAALSAIAKHLPCPVYAAGEQSDPNGGHTLPDNLHCLGFLNRDEMAQWLRRANVYVAPARYEPFGLAILEAARAGCALVLGDIPSLREVWGDAAVYVPSDNEEALLHTLNDLIQHPEYCATLGDRARQRAARYTASRMAASTMQWYRYITKQNTIEHTEIGNPLSGARV